MNEVQLLGSAQAANREFEGAPAHVALERVEQRAGPFVDMTVGPACEE